MSDGMDKATSPTYGLWKRFLLLIPLVAALVLGSHLYIKPKLGTYTEKTFNSYSDEEFEEFEVVLSEPGVVAVESVEHLQDERNVVRVRFRALADGTTDATYGTGEKAKTWRIEVRNGAIIEGGINFQGWQAIQASLCIFLGGLVVLFASVVVRLWRAAWYGYTMVACGGGLLFCLFEAVFFTAVWLKGDTPSLYFLLGDVSYMIDWFSAASLYLMLPLALLVSVSNVSLVRHEGLRPVNLLGIAASVVWVVAYFVYALGWSGPPVVLALMRALLPAGIAFGECLLLSTILCAWLASRHVPDHDVDYLVILGCGIRADGTPCPLLAGRVDRAVSFDESHVAAGAAPATFVPSGGQGPDEPVSEAQSMADYLVSQRGVARDRIALEDRSTTTRENMAFSREVIERHAGCDASEVRVAFSTTNYHVFRGYVCAHQAGMNVEGMGSRTKWYFWPNAFLREFVGLLASRWKEILIAFLCIVAFNQLVAHILSLAIG